MRYTETHRANLGVELSKEDLGLVDFVGKRSVYHVGCLVGELLKRFDVEKRSGCEDYPMARRYAKKRGIAITSSTGFVDDKSYEVVIVDPEYYPAEQMALIEEAVRIATTAVVYGAASVEAVDELYPDNNSYILNDKYLVLDVGTNEHSDSDEE